MTEIILTTAVGVALLVGFSFFLVWYGEYSKRKAKFRYFKKFEFIDKYLAEMETASEKQMEKTRQERMAIFKEQQTPAGSESVISKSGRVAV